MNAAGVAALTLTLGAVGVAAVAGAVGVAAVAGAAVAVLTVAALTVAVAAVLWRVPAADEAMVVTGRRRRVVRDRGVLAVPGLVRVVRVDLALHPLAVDVDAVTAEGIAVRLRLEGGWRVGTDEQAVLDAARHLPGQADDRVAGIVAARARAAVGRAPAGGLVDGGVSLLAGGAFERVGRDVSTLGIELLSLDVVALGDPTGHLANLVRPTLAWAAAAARVARARAEMGGTEAEQRSVAAQARARRDSEAARAGFNGEVGRQAAWARQADPLAADPLAADPLAADPLAADQPRPWTP